MQEPDSVRWPSKLQVELGHSRVTPDDVHQAIAAVCPNFLGVSIGNWDDRATWRADFTDDATPEEREAAMVVIAEFSFQDKHPENAGKPNVVR